MVAANNFHARPPRASDAFPVLNQLESRMRATGRRKALLIGICYIGTENQLEGPGEDIGRIKNLLTRVYGFPSHPTSMLELTDAPRPEQGKDSHIYLPTRENMLRGFQWLTQNAQPGDVLYLHYSGHGIQTPTEDTQYELDGLDECILPLDYEAAGMLRDDDLNEHLVQRIPHGVRLVCLMDCCHSGSGLDLPWTLDPTSGTRKWKFVNTKYPARGDITMIAGCRADQTSADVVLQKSEGKKLGKHETLVRSGWSHDNGLRRNCVCETFPAHLFEHIGTDEPKLEESLLQPVS
eukprot:Blabericola_migrator_1__8261@NODE_4283_length_1241_cov_9_788756_g2645_i0_p1_GENE_NODE_4283_length_1241_cov_9_788756_g2645_i0NODE_4283_length_1241_cov_9_788756_g2645_i0_p1_ORF_typecomplete_len293_score26_86Peptidase_C14/PF00656_22/1_9e48Raptor_N/PF14538_6/0_0013Raptor_N/PF14538_6/1_5e03Peptidase_C13/PF01650_18/0_043CHAT/PF12770_7/0_079_NODE_4283_length_1241_cov_9_788756_g2645_i01651043